MLVRRTNESWADCFAPLVKRVTGLNTLVLCLLLLGLNWNEIVGAFGAYAIGTQIIYYTLLGFVSYLLGIGLSFEQKAPMTLGTCTRNVGPALATLMGSADAPQGAITMCILAIFLGAILSGFAAAFLMKKYGAPAGSAVEPTPVP